MIVLLIVAAVLAVGAVTGLLVWLASSRPSSLDGQTLSEPTGGAAHVPFPPYTPSAPGRPGSGHLPGSAVDGLVLDVTMRGYSMRQVDDALDRLRDELDRRDAEITRLEEEVAAARTARGGGDPELGHGQVLRARSEDSLFSGGVRSFQAGQVTSSRDTEPDISSSGLEGSAEAGAHRSDAGR